MIIKMPLIDVALLYVKHTIKIIVIIFFTIWCFLKLYIKYVQHIVAIKK